MVHPFIPRVESRRILGRNEYPGLAASVMVVVNNMPFPVVEIFLFASCILPSTVHDPTSYALFCTRLHVFSPGTRLTPACLASLSRVHSPASGPTLRCISRPLFLSFVFNSCIFRGFCLGWWCQSLVMRFALRIHTQSPEGGWLSSKVDLARPLWQVFFWPAMMGLSSLALCASGGLQKSQGSGNRWRDVSSMSGIAACHFFAFAPASSPF